MCKDLREGRRLPNGNVTLSTKRYIDTWRAFGKPLCKALGATLIGFDPGILLDFNGRSVDFDADVVYALNAALAKKGGRKHG